MSEEFKTTMSADEVKKIEYATQRIEDALTLLEESDVHSDDDIFPVYGSLRHLIVLGRAARGFRDVEISMQTKPGVYAAGTSIEKPVNRDIEDLKASSTSLAEKNPKYETSIFKCLGDYEKCFGTGTSKLVCSFLFAACIAERIIPLAGGNNG